MSKLISLSSDGQNNTSDFTVRFNTPIELRGLTHECALTRFDSSFSFYNVSPAFGNNIFSYNNGVDDVGLIIPSGLYSIESLIDAIHLGMKTEGDVNVIDGEDVYDINFYPNIATGKVDLVLTSGYTVNFEDNPIRILLGFNSAVYSTSITSPNTADIFNGVSKIFIHCSMVNGSSIYNGNPTDIIYSFSPAFQENEIISVIPETLKYLKVNESNQIGWVRMYISDQRMIPLNFNNKPMSYELHMKPAIYNYN